MSVTETLHASRAHYQSISPSQSLSDWIFLVSRPVITLGSRGYFFLIDTDGRREEWDPYQTVSTVYFILGIS